jgi:hypothetical protein
MSPTLPETRAAGPRWSEDLQPVQHCLSTDAFTLPRRTAWGSSALLTVLLTVVLIAIATWTRVWSDGSAFPQTPIPQSFQPGSGALVPITTVPPPLGYSPFDQPRKLKQQRYRLTLFTERGHPERDSIALTLAAVLAAAGTAALTVSRQPGHRRMTALTASVPT